MTTLFDEIALGSLRLKNRLVMAPLTRMRSSTDGAFAPGELNAMYYAQRASAGLIVSEATVVTGDGRGHPRVPGIHSDEQVAGWKLVTDAVHAAGGVIVCQLWHVGRVSHPSWQADGGAAWGPSPIASESSVVTARLTREPAGVPREMSKEKIREVVAAYRHGAECALEAGFDGVELHFANGYLPNQFFDESANHRDDEYGGSVENRMRFALEVLAAVAEVVPPSKTGVRLSPFSTFQSMVPNFDAFVSLLQALKPLGLAYIHLVEPRAMGGGMDVEVGADEPGLPELLAAAGWDAENVISAGGHTPETAYNAVAGPEAYAHAVAFGRRFISNPDLPERIQAGQALAPYDRSTFYAPEFGDHPEEKGYTDYPTMQEEKRQQQQQQQEDAEREASSKM